MKREFVKDALFGVAVGDALGVPVEFQPRSALRENPVKDMRAFGTHNQPAGTWSDDSSLTFCLAEMLCEGYDLAKLSRMFVNWERHDWWTPHGNLFDIGIATSAAIGRLAAGTDPLLAGGEGENSNGNGSLMRILPLVFLAKDAPMEERWRMVKEVSSLTHRHIRSILGCFIYLEIALQLLKGEDAGAAYNSGCQSVNDFLDSGTGVSDPLGDISDSRTDVLHDGTIVSPEERSKYARVLSGGIGNYPEQEIFSTGYVVHTLEASIWCLLNTRDYSSAVLKAVNLGDDSDTTGAVTGGLAGLLYGWQTIPSQWLESLARRDDIEKLAQRLDRNK